MIAQVKGTVIQVGPTSVVIEVGGLGVLALCSPNTTAGLRSGETATLSTSLVVREDSLTLYGFAGVDERELFELLQTATGVGPKLAQAAIAVLSPDDLRAAIATENLVQLVQGARHRTQGRPAAGDRAEGQDQRHRPGQRAQPGADRAARRRLADQVSQGLQGLGWSSRDAETACDEVETWAGDPGVGVPQLMRAALQTLARR